MCGKQYERRSTNTCFRADGALYGISATKIVKIIQKGTGPNSIIL